jgi:hypothetical protein
VTQLFAMPIDEFGRQRNIAAPEGKESEHRDDYLHLGRNFSRGGGRGERDRGDSDHPYNSMRDYGGYNDDRDRESGRYNDEQMRDRERERYHDAARDRTRNRDRHGRDRERNVDRGYRDNEIDTEKSGDYTGAGAIDYNDVNIIRNKRTFNNTLDRSIRDESSANHLDELYKEYQLDVVRKKCDAFFHKHKDYEWYVIAIYYALYVALLTS